MNLAEDLLELINSELTLDPSVEVAIETDLLLTGRTLTPSEALGLGVVDDVSEDAVSAAMAWAQDVAANCSPTSLAVMKRQLLAADSQTLEEAVDSALVEMRASFQRDDLGEAITAKLQKRAPDFPASSA